MINKSNAHELAQVAREAGALVIRGPLRYPGPETGDWEIDSENIADLLYQLKDRQVLVTLAPVEGDPVHLCGICGFVLSKLGEPCPRCALVNEDVAAAVEETRVAVSVEESPSVS